LKLFYKLNKPVIKTEHMSVHTHTQSTMNALKVLAIHW